jgi:hypothetical protein
MGILAAALPYIAAAGTVISGLSQADQARQRANLLDTNAKSAVASGSQGYANEQIQTSLRMSRLKALSAASGGTSTDPTVQDLGANVGTEGEYRAMSKLYQGQAAAQGLQIQAGVQRSLVAPYTASGILGGASTLFKDIQSWKDKYGGDGPPGANPSAYYSAGYGYGMGPGG